MARAVVVYAHAPRRYEVRKPLAVLAEDEQGVFIAPVWKLEELSGLRRLLGRGELELSRWNEAGVAGRVGDRHPLLSVRSVPRPGEPDHRRLEFFIRMNLSEVMLDQYHYGTIREMPGPADLVATGLAALLAEVAADVARAAAEGLERPVPKQGG